ncbi:MAG: TetR/AcrR family transcriptional regulator [Firmicutes bacterium]|nr:TetR/AcrR family transcriptional regulator [Bacillota bacterium]
MKKSERTELTVSRIVDAAMEEFGKNGYAGGTVNNICKTGINKGLLYHNFSGKDALYLACLRRSCEKLTAYLRERDAGSDLKRYMEARMAFFDTFPNEAHIFFEALLNPPAGLSAEVADALSDFTVLNEEVFQKFMNTLRLRDGVTRENALSYCHLIQTMFNGYFSSPAFQSIPLTEKAKIHEEATSRLLDYMIYGIAKGE